MTTTTTRDLGMRISSHGERGGDVESQRSFTRSSSASLGGGNGDDGDGNGNGDGLDYTLSKIPPATSRGTRSTVAGRRPDEEFDMEFQTRPSYLS
jgi:hypothetical protein